MRLSIVDIAKKSGVSKSTASRVINGGSVSINAREKVLKTMQDLGYSPNFMARGLRGVKSTVIGVLSSGSSMFTDPSLSVRFAAIVDSLQRHGYDLLLVHDGYGSHNGAYAPKCLTYLGEKRIDGLITIGHSDLLQIKRAADSFRNVVYGGERVDPEKGFRVYQGNYDYSLELYSHLLENGHRRILTVSYSVADPDRLIFNRKAALENACNAFHAPYDPDSFFNPYDYGNASQTDLLDEIYRAFLDGGYTAMFVDSIFHTKAIIAYFTHKGLAVPEDFSIVSVDRRSLENAGRENFITCVCIPDYDYGVSIAELMVEVIENEELTCKDVIMPYTIIYRRSVKKLL